MATWDSELHVPFHKKWNGFVLCVMIGKLKQKRNVFSLPDTVILLVRVFKVKTIVIHVISVKPVKYYNKIQKVKSVLTKPCCKLYFCQRFNVSLFTCVFVDRVLVKLGIVDTAFFKVRPCLPPWLFVIYSFDVMTDRKCSAFNVQVQL